ncbi:MAG TPA: DinB family protein [Acidimicrobiales bacterium]|nr:DinB family protein [Acidimicrobiales bacterium]
MSDDQNEAMAVATQILDSLLRKSFDDVRWLLEDVGDEDCFWEPAERCWSVRRRGQAGKGWGTGDWVCEDDWPPPNPLPVTTIAWRLAHLAAWTDVYRNWTFEDQSLDLRHFEVPGSRDGLAGWLCAAQDRFRARVDVLDDAELVELRPAHYGLRLPIHRLVSAMVVEHIHHGAEIGLLRDLRRGHARVQPPPIIEEPL